MLWGVKSSPSWHKWGHCIYRRRLWLPDPASGGNCAQWCWCFSRRHTAARSLCWGVWLRAVPFCAARTSSSRHHRSCRVDGWSPAKLSLAQWSQISDLAEIRSPPNHCELRGLCIWILALRQDSYCSIPFIWSRSGFACLDCEICGKVRNGSQRYYHVHWSLPWLQRGRQHNWHAEVLGGHAQSHSLHLWHSQHQSALGSPR